MKETLNSTWLLKFLSVFMDSSKAFDTLEHIINVVWKLPIHKDTVRRN